MMKRLCFCALVLVAAACLSGAWPAAAGFDTALKTVGRHEKRDAAGNYMRVYSVYTPDLDWERMKQYCRERDWAPGSVTIAYFFNDWKNTPDVTLSGEHFNDLYNDYYVAGCWHHANGNQFFVQYPAQKRSISFS